jgi:hypothetical protein
LCNNTCILTNILNARQEVIRKRKLLLTPTVDIDGDELNKQGFDTITIFCWDYGNKKEG